jgi:hypothetical protein
MEEVKKVEDVVSEPSKPNDSTRSILDDLLDQVGTAEQVFKCASNFDKGQLDENELKAVCIGGRVGEGPGAIKKRKEEVLEAFEQTCSKMEDLYDTMMEKKTA